ncbi:MAG: hypothetical protein IJC52_03280, partial [Clostridia bacterium]|nr:hypothetical protein [Clostridia bacterium]
SNTQQSIVWNGCSLSSLSELTLTDASGNMLVQMEATRAAEWAYITTPLLKEGETYTVSCGSTEETLTLQAGENTLGQAMGGHMGGPMGGGHMGGGPMGDMEPPGGPMGRY